MSQTIDKILRDVSLDERISDGIFRIDEESHMDALRDYFVKHGLTKESAVHVTNRMLEGKYPQRQAWRAEDGILVTFPTPQHKAKAMAKDPRKYTDKDPKPKTPEEPEPPIKSPPEDKKMFPDDSDKEDDKSLSKSSSGNLFNKGNPKVSQGGVELEIEPPRGDKKPEPIPQPTVTTTPVAPRTPERIAAEKEVVKQILQTDDTVLSNVTAPMNVNEKALNHQLNELYKKADEWGFKEAITFLTPYVKS